MGVGSVFRAEIFCVNAGTAHAGEPEVKSLGVAGLDDFAGFEDGRRIGGLELGQGFFPVGIKITRTRLDAVVFAKFVEGFVNSGHDGSDGLGMMKESLR